MHWLLHVLGLDNASGVSYLLWSGFLGDIAIVGGFLAWLRTRIRHHREQLAQAARHHHELFEQAAAHHKALTEQADKHQNQRLVQASEHHKALTGHITSLAADGPVRAGAGSDPAMSEGLRAETAGAPPAGPVVPPAAATNSRTRRGNQPSPQVKIAAKGM